jgi:hypothetical protein
MKCPECENELRKSISPDGKYAVWACPDCDFFRVSPLLDAEGTGFLHGWISVKDRLPDDQEEVLTCWLEEKMIQVQTYYLEYAGSGPWWMFGWQNHLLSAGHITHWMPLPELPEDER